MKNFRSLLLTCSFLALASSGAYAADTEITGAGGQEFLGNGDNLTIDNGGSLTGDPAVSTSGSTGATITNNGSITSNSSEAVDLSGDNSTLTNNSGGLIIGGGSGAGLSISGNGNTVDNSGGIQADTGPAMEVTGSNNTITTENGGNLFTNNIEALHLYGTGDTFTNNGQIVDETFITPTGSEVIIANGSNETFINNNRVSASASGIEVDSDHNTVTNNGNIFAGTGDAIVINGNDNTFTNNGTMDNAEDGVKVTGNNNTIYNSNTGTLFTIFSNAAELLGTGDTLTNDGTIDAHGGVDGVNIGGTNETLINNNSIEGRASGVEISGNQNTVTNNASVTAVNGDGMTISGNHNTIENTIGATLGGFFNGIVISGSNNVFTNDTGATVNPSTDGIVVSGSNNTVTNASGASITGITGAAAHLSGTGDVFTNNGTMNDDNGVTIDTGSNETFINNGSTTGFIAGVEIDSNNNTATNNSTITSQGNTLFINGSNNSFINNATVTSSFTGAQINGSNNTVTNAIGATITSGISDGFELDGTGNTFTNGGTIDAHSGGYGVTIAGTGSDNFTNNGSVTGGIFSGIDVASDNNIVVDNGSVIGTSGNAFSVEGNHNTLTIGSGATTNGTVSITGSNNTLTNNSTLNGITISGASDTLVLGSGSTTNNIDFTGATGGILRYTTGGASYPEGGGFATGGGGAPPVFNVVGGTLGTNYTIDTNSSGSAAPLPPGAVLVTSGSTTLAVTKDEFAGTNVIVNNSAAQSGNLVTLRQQSMLLSETGMDNVVSPAPAPTKTAAADNVESFAFVVPDAIQEPQKTFWTEGFGSYQERPQSGNEAFSRSRAGGALAGFDRAPSSDGFRSGIYVGGFAGNDDLGKTHFRTIDSDGALIGGYIGKSFSGVYVSGQLAGGIVDNTSKRIVGDDTAKADYNSYFLSPSVTVMRPVAVQTVTLVPSLTLRYTGQYDQGYTETGSAANQDVDNRTMSTIGGRAQIEAYLPQHRFTTGVLKPVLRTGLDAEKNIGNNHVDLSVLGSDVSFDPSGNNTLDGIVGVDLSFQMNNGPELYLNGDANIGLNRSEANDDFGVTGRIGARWKF